MTLVSFAHDELQTALLIATVLGVLVFVALIGHTVRRFCRDMDDHERTPRASIGRGGRGDGS
jgi:hypothetical protein